MRIKLAKKFSKLKLHRLFDIAAIGLVLILLAVAGYGYWGKLQAKNQQEKVVEMLESVQTDLDALKNEDPYKTNEELQQRVKAIEETYTKTVATYEDLLKLKEKGGGSDLDKLFTSALLELSKQDYEKADSVLADLTSRIADEETKIASSFTIPENVPQANTPPGAGYSRQKVASEVGTFLVSVVAADIANTKVVVDTASSGDCSNDCPTLALSTYVSRNGAFAGINGSYFCPAEYPSCAGKTNSFDTLLMNKDKVYFNSGNNVYSVNPGVIFGGGYIRFVTAISQWGRDTSIDSMISNYPLLVSGGNVVFGGDDDPKKGSRGARSFVANKGGSVYIGVVHNATVAESAYVMQAMGMENALNLDDGGSTALWSGGFKVGPGRNLPNVILFVRK